MTEQINKIEEALLRLAQNPEGSWNELLKGWKTPYYGFITGWLAKKGYTQPNGNGLRWVGSNPTRTTAAMLYEDAKQYSNKKKAPNKKEILTAAMYQVKPEESAKFETIPPRKDPITRQLALMQYAIQAEVKDPVAFVKQILDDPRI